MSKNKYDIIGLMLVSRAGELLLTTLPALASKCIKTVVVADNTDKATDTILSMLAGADKTISVIPSGFAPSSSGDELIPHQLYRRFRRLQPHIREKALLEAKRMIADGLHIDAIAFPDSDEVFLDHFWDAMTQMVGDDRKDCVWTTPADVYGDPLTIATMSMTWHVRGMKPLPELSAFPWKGYCQYHPLDKDRAIILPRGTAHLAWLTPTSRAFRSDKWSGSSKNLVDDAPLWRLPKSIYEISLSELIKKLSGPPDLTVKEYESPKS